MRPHAGDHALRPGHGRRSHFPRHKDAVRSPHHDLTVKETRFLTHKQSSDLLRISQQCGCGVGLALPEEIRWLATDEPEKLPQEEMDRLHIGTFGHHEGIYGPNQN